MFVGGSYLDVLVCKQIGSLLQLVTAIFLEENIPLSGRYRYTNFAKPQSMRHQLHPRKSMNL